LPISYLLGFSPRLLPTAIAAGRLGVFALIELISTTTIGERLARAIRADP
jgi:hypothetical protein